MLDLTGRTALVTGASGGIGAATARALARQGARVAISGTRTEVLEQLKAELGEGTVVLTATLSDPAAVENRAKQAEAALGQVDILVNNAGGIATRAAAAHVGTISGSTGS